VMADGRTAYVAPDVIVRLLVNTYGREDAEKILKMAEDRKITLKTSLFALYEAIGSIEESDNVDVEMFRRIVETMQISVNDDGQDGQMLKKGYESFNEKRKQRIREVALTESGGR